MVTLDLSQDLAVTETTLVLEQMEQMLLVLVLEADQVEADQLLEVLAVMVLPVKCG